MDPCGVEAWRYCETAPCSRRFRWTLVGLKHIRGLAPLPTGLEFQMDPCGVEAGLLDGEEYDIRAFQMDPCGVEAAGGTTCCCTLRTFQMDPCGVEA